MFFSRLGWGYGFLGKTTTELNRLSCHFIEGYIIPRCPIPGGVDLDHLGRVGHLSGCSTLKLLFSPVCILSFGSQMLNPAHTKDCGGSSFAFWRGKFVLLTLSILKVNFRLNSLNFIIQLPALFSTLF